MITSEALAKTIDNDPQYEFYTCYQKQLYQ